MKSRLEQALSDAAKRKETREHPQPAEQPDEQAQSLQERERSALARVSKKAETSSTPVIRNMVENSHSLRLQGFRQNSCESGFGTFESQIFSQRCFNGPLHYSSISRECLTAACVRPLVKIPRRRRILKLWKCCQISAARRL